MDDLIGKKIGNFRIEELLGKGGMAEVFRGVHVILRKQAAIKVMLPQYANNNEFQQRFIREAKVVAALKHPNIVEIYDFGKKKKEGRFYLIMEMMTAGSLKALIKKRAESKEKGLWLSGIDLVRQAADALTHAHNQGFIHRDIKPDNMLLNQPDQSTSSEECYLLKISDFGLARLVEGDNVTVPGTILGTPAYMAPEQWKGEELGPYSDLYALGVVLYEVVTGKCPFSSNYDEKDKYWQDLKNQHLNKSPVPPCEICPELPSELEKIILRCLEKNPKKRFTSAAELSAKLKDLISASKKLKFGITYMNPVNWSLLHAGVPLIWEFKLTSSSSLTTWDTLVSFQISDLGISNRGRLSDIIKDCYNLHWNLNLERGMKLTAKRSRETNLIIKVGNQTVQCPISFLKPCEWLSGVKWDSRDKKFVLDSTIKVRTVTFEFPSGVSNSFIDSDQEWLREPPLQEVTTAFVLKEHPDIKKIKEKAIEKLKNEVTSNSAASLEVWVDGTSDQKTEVVEAVFLVLYEKIKNYDVPNVSKSSQCIRFPEEIIKEKSATCVDLALLMCGVLEFCNLKPLFILIGSSEGKCHTLVGCWIKEESLIRMEKALLAEQDGSNCDFERLKNYVTHNQMLVIDATACLEKENFKTACERGKKRLLATKPSFFCYALDIQKARN